MAAGSPGFTQKYLSYNCRKTSESTSEIEFYQWSNDTLTMASQATDITLSHSTSSREDVVRTLT